jgi:hypothetical protein
MYISLQLNIYDKDQEQIKIKDKISKRKWWWIGQTLRKQLSTMVMVYEFLPLARHDSFNLGHFL